MLGLFYAPGFFKEPSKHVHCVRFSGDHAAPDLLSLIEASGDFKVPSQQPPRAGVTAGGGIAQHLYRFIWAARFAKQVNLMPISA